MREWMGEQGQKSGQQWRKSYLYPEKTVVKGHERLHPERIWLTKEDNLCLLPFFGGWISYVFGKGAIHNSGSDFKRTF